MRPTLPSFLASLEPPPTLSPPHQPVPFRECKLNFPPLGQSDLELLQYHFNLTKECYVADNVHSTSLATLRPGQWLNDEIIDGAMRIINNRDRMLSSRTKGIRSHCFPSTLCTGLLHIDPKGTMGPYYDYDFVYAWSTRAPGNLDSLDKIVFPLNIGNQHWVCMVAYPQRATIYFFDSLCSNITTQQKYLGHILHYLQDEYFRVHGRRDERTWSLVCCDKTTTPQQQNSSDCGVFVCLVTERLMRDLPLTFTAQDAVCARSHIALALLKSEAPLW
jgi:sentrin-specific protease 1